MENTQTRSITSSVNDTGEITIPKRYKITPKE